MRKLAWLLLMVGIFLSLPSYKAWASQPVIINEIMWDGDEYLELYNPSEQMVDLNNWQLTRQAPDGEVKTILQFTDDETLAAHSYYLITKKDSATTVPAQKIVSSLSLLNSGEQVTLRDETGQIVDQANPLGPWVAGANTTTGQSMERNTVSGDGTQTDSWHTSTGHLGGRDGTPGSANSQPLVNQAPEAVITGPTAGLTGQSLTFSAEDSSDPEDDTLTYSWDWGEAGALSSTADTTHTYLNPGNYTVRLTVSDGHSSASQEQVVAIASPSPSPTPTPKVTPTVTPTPTIKPTATPRPTVSPKPTVTPQVAGTIAKVVSVENIRAEKLGTVITTTGIVSAPPQLLGDKIFYLAGSGIQVYLGSGTLPALKLGDEVEVTGELASYLGEARLKVASAADIKVAATNGAAPDPHSVNTSDINEGLEGSLVIVQGNITATSGDTFYIDDGSGPVKVVIQSATGIKKPVMKKGDEFTITGIVSQTTSGFRLLPRFQDDIKPGLVTADADADTQTLKKFPTSGTLNWPQFIKHVILTGHL